VSAKCLGPRFEFLILCAARTGAVIAPPATRSILSRRYGRCRRHAPVEDQRRRTAPHPLCDRAIEILKALPHEQGNPYLFIGGLAGCGLSNMAMSELMKDMAFASTTPGRLAVPHGFRSTFKDWVSETTSYPNFVSEAALWHAVADKLEAAYRRGDLFNKRRKLMADWAKYCAAPKRSGDGDVVVPIRRRK
jgi:hypothetical protein